MRLLKIVKINNTLRLFNDFPNIFIQNSKLFNSRIIKRVSVSEYIMRSINQYNWNNMTKKI